MLKKGLVFFNNDESDLFSLWILTLEIFYLEISSDKTINLPDLNGFCLLQSMCKSSDMFAQSTAMQVSAHHYFNKHFRKYFIEKSTFLTSEI